MTQELKNQIKVVVEARDRLYDAAGKKIASYNKWVEENEVLIDNETTAKNIRQTAEDKLRELTLQSYAETGDKKPIAGVGIKIMSRIGYETEKAMEWALEHKLALKLDNKAFEDIAKTSKLPFVIITEEPTATIATQLEIVE